MLCGCFVNFIISIILGIILGILVGTGVITILAPVVFGLIAVLSVLFLIIFVAALLTPTEENGRCFCSNVSCFFLGLVVAIVLSIVVISITLAGALALVPLGILTFVAFSAFILEFLSLTSLLTCIARKKCCD